MRPVDLRLAMATPCFLPCHPETGCPACHPHSPAPAPPRPSRARHRRPARNRIGDRDNWTCGYCHTHVDRDLRWPHPLSPSVGHIRWVGFGAGGTDNPVNLRIEHLACNMQNIPHLLLDTLSPGARADREQAGLPPYTEQERRAIIDQALDDPPPARPRSEAVRRYWRPGRQSWRRWHTENPGSCTCAPGAPSSFCLPASEPTS
ncbi:hypothetical protein [Sphaerisporangium aureirubrum]|uniref:HNH endonuclease n=1 Tax=Sphaerisporangium aureirubrum TaxID=1544736 RepID=A0ABW1NDU2_9ACTN